MSERLQGIVNALLSEIDAIVDRKVEEKLPEFIRALGIRDASASSTAPATVIGSAEDVARLLGRSLRTQKERRAAKVYVYNLARRNGLPSIRISERRLKFDLNQVREWLDNNTEIRKAS